MERFIAMSVEELELLVACDGLELEDAAYPPCCTPAHGPLRITECDRGGVKIEVSPSRVSYDSFELRVLFDSGRLVLGSAEYLAGFFRGPIAKAFGVECEPIRPRPPEESVPDEVETDEPEPSLPPRRRKPRPPRIPATNELVSTLARTVHGQEPALTSIARAVTTQLVKRSPARPESMVLVGPTGTGKTSTIEALPAALEELGCPDVHVFRVDCGELVHASDLRRVLGAPPSYIGYVEEMPLTSALRKPGCILLFDEVEKATETVFDIFLGLLDEGRLTAPDGETIEAPGAIVALTTNLGAYDLAYRLRDIEAGTRQEHAVCRDHLLLEGWPPELVGRIGTVAVFDALNEECQRGVAENAIRDLAREFGFEIEELPDVLVDVVRDLADASDIGARALTYAARDLLAEALAHAAREGAHGAVRVDPGPPPCVVALDRVDHAS